MPDIKVVNEILRQGKKRPRKHVKAALETGLVESGLRNLPGGDADSAGWRQERASLYPNPTNIKASVRRFYQEAAQHDRGQPAGQLAAAVQRPAAQYRDRYGKVSEEAEAFMDQLTGGATSPSSRARASGKSRVVESTKQSFDREGYEQANRRSVLGSLIAKRNPNSILLRTGVLGGDSPDPDSFVESILQRHTAPSPARTKEGIVSGSQAASLGGGANAAVNWARSVVGVAEAGENRGKQIDKWERQFGMTGQAWCAMFTSIAATRAGMPSSGRTASVAQVRQQAQSGRGGYRKGFVPARRAQPGDLILFGNDHIGMVEKRTKKGLVMIAGNDSDKVNRRTVPFGEGDIVRPKYR